MQVVGFAGVQGVPLDRTVAQVILCFSFCCLLGLCASPTNTTSININNVSVCWRRMACVLLLGAHMLKTACVLRSSSLLLSCLVL